VLYYVPLMSPEVVAAVIAASASILTLIGTLAAQYLGRRATSRDTDKTLKEQGNQLDRTLAEQREQLDRTLAEQREQLDKTLAEQRSRTLNERFASAAEQLGHERPVVQVGAIYALEQVAKASLDLRAPIHELLSAFIRAESTWTHHDPATHKAIEAGPVKASELPLLRIRAPHVQAAITVLGRRCAVPGEVLGLQSVDLRVAYLGDANLHGAILGRSMLAGADLSRADLSDVNLRGTNLTGVILRRAVLSGADLARADLTAADLQQARCDGTTIWPEGFDWGAAGVVREAGPPTET
jgi:hypothetical protein